MSILINLCKKLQSIIEERENSYKIVLCQAREELIERQKISYNIITQDVINNINKVLDLDKDISCKEK